MSNGLIVEKIRQAHRAFVVGDNDDSKRLAVEAASLMHGSCPILGLDIDGTITERPEIFSVLSNFWPGKVFVVTYRKDRSKTETDLLEFGIRYDKLILSPFLDKSGIIVANGINVFIDDQDECVLNVPEDVTILKIRNGGNFDNGKWLYSSETGKQVWGP